MFHAIITVVAISTLAFLYVQKKGTPPSRSPWHKDNLELETYFELSVDPDLSSQALQKQLLLSTVAHIREQVRIETEKRILYPLFQDRIIGHQTWKSLEKADEELKFERITIEAEASRFKDLKPSKLFSMAYEMYCTEERRKGKGTRSVSASDSDLLLCRRVELLEENLFERMTAKT